MEGGGTGRGSNLSGGPPPCPHLEPPLIQGIAKLFGPDADDDEGVMLMVQAGSTAVSMAFSRSRDTVANVVRKQWKCSYVECSARYNWRVVALFRELMKSVDHSVRQRTQRGVLTGTPESSTHLTTYLGAANTTGTSTNRLHEALQHNGCIIL